MTFFRCFVIVLAIFKFNHFYTIRKNHYCAPSAPFFSSSTATCKTSISPHNANNLYVHYKNEL